MLKNDAVNIRQIAEYLDDNPASMSGLLFWLETRVNRLEITKTHQDVQVNPEEEQIHTDAQVARTNSQTSTSIEQAPRPEMLTDSSDLPAPLYGSSSI